MNYYDDTIFCDKNIELLSEIKHTIVDVPEVEVFLKVDENIEHTNTRYVDKFYYYKNDTIIGKSLKYYGEYTELELDLLKNFMNKNYVVYDVGANIGYHTVAFAKLADRVYAFEPNKKHLDLLYKNIKSFDNITVYDVACSDTIETKYIDDFDLSVPGNYGEMYMNTFGQECKSIVLDDLDDVYGPDLLKIDVEGHELQVLKGAVKTITEFNPIIFYEAHGKDLPEIYDLLNDLQYHLYWYPCPNYNLRNYKQNSNNVFGNGGVVNILAMPKTHKKISNLLPVIDRDDTIQKAFDRYRELNT